MTLCLAFASSFPLAKVSLLIIDGIFSNFGVFYDFGGGLLSFRESFVVFGGLCYFEGVSSNLRGVLWFGSKVGGGGIHALQ